MATIKEVKNKHGLSYQVTIRIKPYKTIYKTFKDASPRKAKKDAQQWASKIEYEMTHGLYKEYNNPICSNRENISTMQDLITFFQNEVASQRYRTPEKYSVMYSWWIAKIGSIKVQDLSASMLSSCKQILKTEKIKKGKQEVVRGNNTINKPALYAELKLGAVFKTEILIFGCFKLKEVVNACFLRQIRDVPVAC